MHYGNDLYNYRLPFLNRNFLFRVPIGEFSTAILNTHIYFGRSYSQKENHAKYVETRSPKNNFSQKYTEYKEW